MARKAHKLAYNVAMNILRQRGIFNKSILYVLLAAVAAGFGLLAAQQWHAPRTPTMETVRLFPQVRTLPDFRLNTANGDGASIDNAALKGRWHLIFLGFTYCPDVCPTTLGELSKAQKQWETAPKASRPRLLLVSVDPERDSPKALADYAAFFHKDTLTATIREPALRDFAQGLGFVYTKSPLGENDYTIDHSATIAVIDPQGNQAGIIRPPFAPEKIARDMLKLSETTQ
jgi:protein SCO1